MKWKIGKLIPLWKGRGQEKLNPASFRPVSLLPVLGKLTERAVQIQISQYMEKEELWHPNQHVYRKHHSAATSLTQISDTIFEAAEARDIAAAMTINESSAFDCIDFKILMYKMKIYGFN